jgi:hypothetical protein
MYVSEPEEEKCPSDSEDRMLEDIENNQNIILSTAQERNLPVLCLKCILEYIGSIVVC